MAGPRIELPRRERRYTFALTPLADAMFQLLIFFMLASSLTPYSLLTVQPGEGAPEAAFPGALPDPGTSETATEQDAQVWLLEAGAVRIRGTAIPLDEIAPVVDALGSGGARVRVTLLVRDTARVQDLTTVLARLQASDAVSVSVVDGEP